MSAPVPDAVPVPDAERLARLALASVAEPGSNAVHLALEQATAAELWAALRAGDPLGRVTPRAREGLLLRVRECRPEQLLARLEACGGRVLCPGDDEWPPELDWPLDRMSGDIREMAPPWVLLVRGPHRLRDACASSVAIIGARAATGYGLHVATDWAFALAEAGVSVVSGGAYGIDAAAHRGALAAQGAPTIAVLACGPDTAYPRGHASLFQQIAEQGLVVSEVPPGSGVTRVRFLVRNRLVAALARGTVVVEAARRSGTTSTAGRAADLVRPVMAVPGPVTSAMSQGCNDMIREGKAVLVTEPRDVLEQLRAIGDDLSAPARGPVHPRDELAESARRLLDAVPARQPIGVARLARRAGVSAVLVSGLLVELGAVGLVEQRDGGWRLTRLGASPPGAEPAG